jgi:gamma-glutamyltranspeptidase/glutathione hydrolase
MLLAQVVIACLCLQAEGPGLSPADWPANELAKYSVLNTLYGLSRPLAESETAMIGGTTGALAIHAGLQVLKQGGSAADAAVATALAQICLSGGSWNSYAGIFYAVYYDAKSRKVYCLNAGYNTVLGETEPLTIPSQPKPSGRTALVPGFTAGIEAMHKRFGRLPFDKLFEPAIYLADKGFTIDAVMDVLIRSRKQVLTRLPEGRAIFTKPDGELYSTGDTFRQPALAKTLRAVASRGAAYMYIGEWGRKLVEAVQAEGGKLAMEDLRGYKAEWSEPIRTTFGEYEVCAVGPPELGGVMLLEALNMVEAAELKEMGRPRESPNVLYWLIQIARFGHLPTWLHPVGDPDNPDDPLAPANRILKSAAQPNWRRVRQEGWEVELYKSLSGDGSHSDGIVVVDAEGNVAAVVHSINTISWGTTGIFVDGVSIPDSAAIQPGTVEKAGPGKRLPNITNPCIVLKQGRPVLASSAVGAALHETMLQNLVNVLAYGMDLKTSVDGPTFWGPRFSTDATELALWSEQCVTKGDFSDELLKGVRERGQAISELTPEQSSSRIGYWLAVQIDPGAGKLRGTVLPKMNGIVEGY